jgi:hypothetical protein
MADLSRFDLSLNWSHRLGLRNSEVFFRGIVVNLFNRDEFTYTVSAGCGTGGCIDTTIITNRTNTALARFNPFTEQPVQGVNWTKGTAFGTPTNRYGYQDPRQFSLSLGVRF